MGFPIGYTQVLPSKLLLPILSLLILLKNLAFALIGFLGLSDDCFFFLDGAATSWEAHALSLHRHQDHSVVDRPPEEEIFHYYSHSTNLHNVLPVVRFSTLLDGGDGGGGRPTAETCTVCLHEFEGDDEIMLPMNCRHVFHRSCLGRWIGYNHRMCPLCRAPLVTDHHHLPEINNNVGYVTDDVMWLNWR